jgi:pseudouridine-5'-phosphate glycosidase
MGKSLHHYLTLLLTDKQNDRLVISEEVEHALQSNKPIIALESAIITHGTSPPSFFVSD